MTRLTGMVVTWGIPFSIPSHTIGTSKDVVLVQINHMQRNEIPKNAQEIMNRVNEITFNGALMKELRAIEFVGRLLDKESVDPNQYKKMLLHVISAEDKLKPLNASSKQNLEWEFLVYLRDVGRNTASAWLDENYDKIGNESSVDLRSLFQ